MVWPAIIAAGASLASSALSAYGSSQQTAANRDINAAILRDKELDRALQREFAKNGIRWRVQDAKAAGIHPLFALGGSTSTYTPSSISLYPESNAWSDVGSGIAQAGQDISRAIDATRTRREREQAREQALERAAQFDQLNLEKAGLENDLLRSQIAKLNATQVGPPMPSGMESAMFGVDAPRTPQGFTVQPVDIPATQPGVPSQGAGAFPEISWMRTPSGWTPVPNREALEDADLGNPSAWSWYWRNQALPTLGVSGNPPPDSWLPPKAVGWRWRPMRQEWEPAYEFDFFDRWFYGLKRGRR